MIGGPRLQFMVRVTSEQRLKGGEKARPACLEGK